MKVGVLMGGASDERDVSLASGTQVAVALRTAGHQVVSVDTAQGIMTPEVEAALVSSGVGQLPPEAIALSTLQEEKVVELLRDPRLAPVDVFFLALHGGIGEDGTIQGILDAAGVSYTGSDQLGCSLAMDKVATKRVLREAGIPTPDWLAGSFSANEIEVRLGLPVIVKAASGGSSLRLVLAHDSAELELALEESSTWADTVLYERYHTGREFTVGVAGGEAFPVGEIVPQHEIFDYECKYQAGMAQEIFPADISSGLAERLRALALEVHGALQLRDYSRVDFIVDEASRPWCLEANALPGMTTNSLFPKGAAVAGIGFPELCDRIAKLARARSGDDST